MISKKKYKKRHRYQILTKPSDPPVAKVLYSLWNEICNQIQDRDEIF